MICPLCMKDLSMGEPNPTHKAYCLPNLIKLAAMWHQIGHRSAA